MSDVPVTISHLSRAPRHGATVIAHLLVEPGVGRPLRAVVANENKNKLTTSAIEQIIYDIETGVMVVSTAHSTYAIGPVSRPA